METTPRHPLIDEYLLQLRSETAHLPPAERDRLVDSVLARIQGSLDADSSDADIRSALTAVGQPADIAMWASATRPAKGGRQRGWLALWLSVGAVVVLVFMPGMWFVSAALGLIASFFALKVRRDAYAPSKPATAALVIGMTVAVMTVLMFIVTLSARTRGSSDPPPIQVPATPTTVRP